MAAEKKEVENTLSVGAGGATIGDRGRDLVVGDRVEEGGVKRVTVEVVSSSSSYSSSSSPPGGVDGRDSVKVVVVGDGAVGKTSLLVSFTLDRFPTEHVPTVFANFAKKMTVCGEQVNLWLCDTAGQEELDRLRVMSYSDTRVFLLCFSVTDPSSLHNVLEKWLPEVRFHCPSAQCVLVATKIDLRNSEQEIERLTKDGLKPVSTEQGQQFAHNLGVDTYLECSALTQTGLTEVFEMAARVALAPTNQPLTSLKRRKTQSRRFHSSPKSTKPCSVI